LNPKEAPPNSVLVRDNEDIIEIIQKMLDKIGTFEWQKKQRTFLLRFSSPQLIKEVLLSSSLLSSGGSIQIDEATNSLIIEDGAYQLSRIEKAISLLEKSNQTNIPAILAFLILSPCPILRCAMNRTATIPICSGRIHPTIVP
ncbi:unnamed protein product, partial [marine sediment metagenome]